MTMMRKSNYVFIFLATFAQKAAANIFENGELDLKVLGKNDLSELEYSYVFGLEESSCEYSLEISFRHQPEFFVGTNETCKPATDDPYEGIPVLAGRWRWERLPLHIREATGIDHPSVDYNPCGKKRIFACLVSPVSYR